MNEEYQCLLYGALLLANGLEDLGLKHAHEFGWDNSINVLRQRHQGFNGQVSGFPSCLQAELYVREKLFIFLECQSNPNLQPFVVSEVSTNQRFQLTATRLI